MLSLSHVTRKALFLLSDTLKSDGVAIATNVEKSTDYSLRRHVDIEALDGYLALSEEVFSDLILSPIALKLASSLVQSYPGHALKFRELDIGDIPDQVLEWCRHTYDGVSLSCSKVKTATGDIHRFDVEFEPIPTAVIGELVEELAHGG